MAANDDTPTFGKANDAPPSWFARVPSAAIEDRKLTPHEFRVLAAICSYANNQGFAWPNQTTIRAKAGVSRNLVDRAIRILKRRKYIEIVSCYRSHPKWRRVMGNVYRVIYDDRLETDKLIAEMNHEDQPAATTPP